LGEGLSFAAKFNLYYLIFLYNIFVFVYTLLIRIASGWNAKAAQWLQGRKNVWKELEASNFADDSIVWIHTSSAGEFEQAKPVIDALKKNYPSCKIIVSFFSPSGYSIGKNYKQADHITYLPVDTKTNAKRFVEIINPNLAIFVKYDFWYHYLNTVHSKKIPLLLISAVFRKEQSFFKWYGGFYRNMLHFFNAIFVQDKLSWEQLKKYSVENCFVSGDTRFDRVATIAENFFEIEGIEEFVGNSKVLIAGSTWPEDEQLIKDTVDDIQGMKLIIAPHEIHEQHIVQIQKQFPGSVLYSELKNNLASQKVLIINNVGMLSRLYKYATITYVGGGFTRDGIHNILEAAVYGKPVLFGPNYKKYREAQELIEKGGAFCVKNNEELKINIENLLNNPETYHNASTASFDYIRENKGATGKIMSYIQEKRLLTN
jgi:3-deoxy-D-manno-octulosonic-acid transferase